MNEDIQAASFSPEFFLVDIESLFKFALDIIDKWPRFLEAFSWKNVRVKPRDTFSTSTLMTLLILTLFVIESYKKNERYQPNKMRDYSSGYIKMSFTFLIEMIVIDI